MCKNTLVALRALVLFRVSAQGPENQGFPSRVRKHRRAEAPKQGGERFFPRRCGLAKGGHTLKGFSAFLARGNVIDLAVAVVVGAAFTAVVNSLVKDLITPLVAALVGKPDFSKLGFTLNHSHFAVGDFVNALITFLLDAVVIYYFIVVPLRLAAERFDRREPVLAQKTCPECMSEIPQDARRCKFCTAVLR
jgi:large conductance mechanosensitive channel